MANWVRHMSIIICGVGILGVYGVVAALELAGHEITEEQLDKNRLFGPVR